MRKSIKFVLVLNLLFFGFFGTTGNVFAETDKEVEDNSLVLVEGMEKTLQEQDTGELFEETDDFDISPQGIQVPAILGGVVIGWVAGGFIEYATGYSPEYLVKRGIGHVHDDLIRTYRDYTKPITPNLGFYVGSGGEIAARNRCLPGDPCPLPAHRDNKDEEYKRKQ